MVGLDVPGSSFAELPVFGRRHVPGLSILLGKCRSAIHLLQGFQSLREQALRLEWVLRWLAVLRGFAAQTAVESLPLAGNSNSVSKGSFCRF